MAGDTETGVTIHETVKELDAGPIAAQRSFPVAPEDDAGAVFARAAELAVELLDGALPEPTFRPQEGEPTYAQKITAADRELDWSRPPEELLNTIRALSPHIGARGELHGRRVTVWRARLENGRLVPVEVQPEGGRRMDYDAWLRGLR
jgi:methionyl-tRNA formyltransferase